MSEPRVTYVLTKYVQPTQTFVTGEIAELRRQGVGVEVIAMEHGAVAPEEGDDVVFLCDEHPPRAQLLREHVAALLRRPAGYAAFLVDVVRMRREMGRLPEQVPWLLLPGVAARLRGTALHAHFAWSGAAAALLLAHLTGRPWSVTVHANDVFNRQRNLRRKLRAADRVVTVCRYNEAWMREHLGLTRDVDIVVCGVEPPAEPWPELPGADVVVVGRLVEKKGIDVLVRAAALLLAEHPDLQVHVIGEGRERPALEELVVELGLGGHVQLQGARTHEESLARIAGARVFCLPARVARDGDRDSMPVVIKEAMARRVPVVATDVVAIPEMLDDGCGVLVPPDDPAALAAALGPLLTDPEAAGAMTARAWTRVREHFTLQGETAKLRGLQLPSGSGS
jgi:glycosyltransferase involved in cell wall biosynthesis